MHAVDTFSVPSPSVFSLPVFSFRSLRTFFIALTLLLAGVWSGTVWAVDVNQATQEQLQTISGIGPKTAQTIIEERNRGGSFASFEDLSARVKGIGAKRAQALQAAGLELAAPDAKAASPTSAAKTASKTPSAKAASAPASQSNKGS